MAFSASDAAFEGFRIVRREPVTMAIWAVVLLVLSAGASAAVLPMLGQATASMTPGVGATSPARLAAFGELFRVYMLAAPIYLIVFSVFTAAVYRAVLRPADSGFGRLRLGGDELRLIGLYLLMGLFFFVVFLAAALVVGLLAGGVIAATRSRGAVGIGLTLAIVYLVMIAVAVWLGVRLSFAAPMTFAEKRIRFFGSWALTKGRFWPLFGCYLLAWVFTILVLLVDVVVSGALMLGAAGGSFSQVGAALFRPNVTSLASLWTPVFIIRLVVGAAFGVVVWTVGLAAPAAAYRQIAAPRPQDQAETFS